MSPKRAAIAIAALMILPLFSFTAPAANIQHFVSTFGDGSASKELVFPAPGSLVTANFSIQTGLIVDNATFKVNGAPDALGNYPTNISIDVGDDGDYEWEFNGTGYGALGKQTLFSNGADHINVTLPKNGGANTTAAIRLPKTATVKNAQFNLTNLRGGGGTLSVAIEAALTSRSRDTVNNDPVYSIQTLCQNAGWTATIVSGTDIDTAAELDKYSVVISGDSGSSDDDHATFQSALQTWVQNGGGFVGLGWICYSTKASSEIDNILPIKCNEYSGYSYDTAGNLAVVNANHEITVGVNGFPVQQFCEYPTNGVDAGAITLLNAPSGKGCVVAGNYGSGRSVYIGPVSFGCFQSYANTKNYYADNNFKNLLLNSLSWSANKLTLNCSLDSCNDGSIEWSNSSMNGTERSPDLAAQFNSYLAAAPPNGTDAYGNQYVDIPLTLLSNTSGTVRLGNLSLNYDFDAKVGANPISGNLGLKLNELVPDDIGTTNASIPIRVNSESAGKLRLHSVNITAHPPVHVPDITSTTPTGDTPMLENDTLQLSITASDIYRNPLTYKWFRDGTLAPNATTTAYDFTSDFNSSGKHIIRVIVDNGLGNSSFTWNITVKNVNRAPIINAFFPPDNPTINENTSLEFRVNATDPDRDNLRYAWFVNGLEKTSGPNQFYPFTTDFASAGSYDIRAAVIDNGIPSGLSVNKTWKLTVNNVNLAPRIDTASPRTPVKIRETESVTFSVSAKEPDGQGLSYKWFFNGTETAYASTFTYKSDYNSAGNYSVKVVVSDGELCDTREWLLTVDNVNRLPIPVIDSPKETLDFLNTEPIRFVSTSSSDPDGDELRYRWLEGGTVFSTSKEFSKSFAVAGEHTVTLEVTDALGGINTTVVNFRVHFISLAGVLELDKKIKITQDDKLVLTATFSNSGDAPAEGFFAEFLVDNRSIEKKPLPTIDAGGADSVKFNWNALKGTHVMTVKIGNESWNHTAQVEPKLLGLGGTGNTGILPWLIIVIVVCCAAGAGAYAYSRKKKKAVPEAPPAPYAQAQPYQPAPPQYESYPPAQQTAYAPPQNQSYQAPQPQYQQAPAYTPAPTQTYAQPAQQTAYQQAPQPQYQQAPAYTPVQEAPAHSQAATAVAATAVSAPAAGTDDAAQQRHKALKIINQVSELVASIEASGIDVSEARPPLDLARSFVKADNPTKAIQYARKADVIAREKRDKATAQR